MGCLLMQHKEELGNKYVAGVRVLRNDGTEYDTHEEVDLVFYIADVPPERQIPNEPNQDPPQSRAETNALAAAASAYLVQRNAPGYPVEEHVLGSNNILRVHTIMAY